MIYDWLISASGSSSSYVTARDRSLDNLGDDEFYEKPEYGQEKFKTLDELSLVSICCTMQCT